MILHSFFNSVHDRWANLHPLWRFLLVVLLVGACGLFGVRPAYGVFKTWRMGQNLKDAKKAVEDVRMDQARDLSLSVLRSGNPSIEAFRILEKSTASLRDPRHGEFARALISHPQGTDEDRLTGFQGVVMELPLGLVGEAWNALPPECQTDARFARAFAARLIAERRLKEATSVLLAVPEERRDGAVHRRLIQVLIGSGSAEGFEQAQRLIVAHLPTEGGEVSEWLDLLEEIPAVSLQGRLLEPIRRLLVNAAAGDAARVGLILARMDYATRFSLRAEVLEQTIEKWQAQSPVLLARFLNDLGLHQQLLETLPAESIEAHPELFAELLEAAETVGAWDRVLPLLNSHGHRLPKLEELAHRTVLASKTADAVAQTEAWNAAMAEAEGNPSNHAFLTIHRIVLRAGLPDQAEQAMIGAIRTGIGPLPLYEDLKPLLLSLEKKGQEKTLMEISAVYLSLEPANPVLLTQYAYLACLHEVAEPKTVIAAMEPLAKAFPQQLPIHLVIATAYLFDAQPAKAAQILDPFQLDPAKLAPAYRAIFLATQVLNFRIPKDDPQIEGFPWKSLQASERRKFSELIRSVER